MHLKKSIVGAVIGAVMFQGSGAVTAPTRQTATQPPVTFEAASVKRSTDGSRGMDIRFLPGRVVVTYQTLDRIIEQAYDIQVHQIIGGPSWIHTDRFDIVATTGDESDRAREKLMLQSLLASRFKLELERQTKPGTVYYLTAPNPHDLKSPANKNERSMVYQAFGDNNGKRGYYYDGHNATMGLLAANLSRQLHAPVIDETGLVDHYDFRIDYTYDLESVSAPDPDTLSIFTSLTRNVGLKLTAGKGPVETFVVRHASPLEPQ